MTVEEKNTKLRNEVSTLHAMISHQNKVIKSLHVANQSGKPPIDLKDVQKMRLLDEQLYNRTAMVTHQKEQIQAAYSVLYASLLAEREKVKKMQDKVTRISRKSAGKGDFFDQPYETMRITLKDREDEITQLQAQLDEAEDDRKKAKAELAVFKGPENDIPELGVIDPPLPDHILPVTPMEKGAESVLEKKVQELRAKAEREFAASGSDSKQK